MPFVAILVFPMHPTNVFKHCHNNGWLSLPHNKPICHFWQHSGVKKEVRRPKRCGHGVLRLAVVYAFCCHPCLSNGLPQCFQTLPQQWLALLASQQAHLPLLATLRSQKRGQATQEVWPWCTAIGSCICLLLPSLSIQWTPPMFSNTATTMVGSPCLTTSPFATLGNTQESKRGQMTQEVWPCCTVIGSCRCLLLP